MAINDLNLEERKVICECLNFINKSGFVDEYEFQTRLGVEKNELEKVTYLCPEFDNNDLTAEVCISNCLNEVCNGLSISESDWNTWFTTSIENVENVFNKWAKLKDWKVSK